MGVNIIDINKLSESDIDYNKSIVEEIDYKINKYSNIYNYKYEYI